MIRLALLLIALVGAGTATASDSARATWPVGAAAPAEPESFPTPLAGTLTRVLAALALISAAGAGLTWWSRKRRGFAGGTSSRIQVVATRAIGPRHHVVLIEVGERRLLLGTAPESVRALADLSEVPAFAAQLSRELPDLDRAGTPGRVSFEGIDV